MQKPSLDPVQVKSMLDDFLRFLAELNFDQIWKDTLKADPNFPVTRARGGWRGTERASNGSPGDWKQSLTIVANKICIEFSEQLAWRFENLDKFKWMDLIHPSKFNSNKSRPSHEIRAAIGQFQKLYPFAISDATSLEHNLDVLYENKEISVLIRKITQERDQVVQKRKERRNAKQRRLDEGNFGAGDEEQQQEQVTVEDVDQFEMADETFIEEETIKEGTASLQDLLTVISSAGLEDALPQAMVLLEIAAVTPLTSVH